MAYNQLAHTTFQQPDGLLAMGNDWSLMVLTQTPGPNPPAQVINHICESSVLQYGSWLLWTGGGTGWLAGAQYSEAAIHAMAGDPSLNWLSLPILSTNDIVGNPTGLAVNAQPDVDGISIDFQAVDSTTSALLGSLVKCTFVPDAKLRIEYFQGVMTLYYNGIVIQTVSGLSYDSVAGRPGLIMEVDDALANVSISEFAAGTITLSPVFFISGNAGIAGATVSYAGTSSGSVVADGSGNYLIYGLANGSYVVTPTKTGYTFSPTGQNVTTSGG
jgi:hypothetical protein